MSHLVCLKQPESVPVADGHICVGEMNLPMDLPVRYNKALAETLESFNEYEEVKMSYLNLITLPGSCTVGPWFVQFDEDSGEYCVARNVSETEYEQAGWYPNVDVAEIRALALNLENEYES